MKFNFNHCLSCPFRGSYSEIRVNVLKDRREAEERREPGELLYFDNLEFVSDDEDLFSTDLFFREDLSPLLDLGPVEELPSGSQTVLSCRVPEERVQELAERLQDFHLEDCENQSPLDHDCRQIRRR